MKRIFLILIALIILNLNAFAEEIPPNGCGYSITKKTNPIYWGYMEDYAEQLRQALYKSHMFRLRGWGASYKYYITRDGRITDMKGSTFQNDYFDNKVKEIILSVKPLPFRDGMNLDEMHFDVFLGYERYNEIGISIGGSFIKDEDIFHMMILINK